MQPRIRAKFVGVLIIVAVVPLCIAIVGIQILGHQYYKRERGRLYEAVARHVASALRQAVTRQIDKLEEWVVLTDLTAYLARENATVAGQSDREIEQQGLQFDKRWPTLSERSPEIQAFLTNSIARKLRDLQSVDPLWAEIIVADAHGRLIAATGKTSDYWQADETWWQHSMAARPGYVYLEGVNYDQSAHVFSLDVSIPIRPRHQPNASPVGVVKGVLNASAMFSSPPRILTDESASRQIVRGDGTFLFDLMLQNVPPFTMRLNVSPLSLDGPQAASGWSVARLLGAEKRLVGFAALDLGLGQVDDRVPSGVTPMYVLIHDNAATVLAPVQRQLWLLAISGSLILLLCATVGYYIATQNIIRPIELLRSAARMIAASAKISQASSDEREVKVSPATVQLLEKLRAITTNDELGDLARDFGSMARRVLSYHEQLEDELARKTAEMQRDLDIAHEFQEALMPRNYPQVIGDSTTPLQLNFHHEYQAASTVGGDFFDVHKLADHRAGIFIADVMGHGARAALITAILRTLLQDLAVQADDPAHFLALINQHFHDITSQSDQFVFASAFYMVVDTERAIASYASAGHPSPLLVDRTRRLVAPLIEHLENNPALGVFRESTYTNFTSFIKENDLLLLFTDGLFEAINADGEEFGRQRLRDVIERQLDRNVSDLTDAMMKAVNQFAGSAGISDDICLVVVEVAGATSPQPLAQDKR